MKLRERNELGRYGDTKRRLDSQAYGEAIHIGYSLKCAREAAGYTKEELSRKSGIPISTITKAERGEPISLQIISKILHSIGTVAKLRVGDSTFWLGGYPQSNSRDVDYLCHRGYCGSIKSVHGGGYNGSVQWVDGLNISYSGETLVELRTTFQELVDKYIEECKENGIIPTYPLHYKGYVGSIECYTEKEGYHGQVLGLKGHCNLYEGDTIEELEKDFKEAVDFYLENCSMDKVKQQMPSIDNF